MKKAFAIIIFFLLLEYQTLFSPEVYSLITGAGLIGLCLYLFITGDQAISFDGKKEIKARTKLGRSEILIASIYSVILILTLLFGKDLGFQITFILITTIIGVTTLSFLEIKKNPLKKDGKATAFHPTVMSIYTIPIIYLCVVNYLLSVQIAQSVAYQSILLLSCLIFFDTVNKQENLAEKIKTLEIEKHEFEHRLFHCWIKYWNFFIGIWYIISLRVNGVIAPQQEYFMLFAFIAMLFLFLLSGLNKFTINELVGVVFFAALLTIIDPLTAHIAGTPLSAHFQTLIIFITFDLGDVYFHQRKYKEATIKYWSQKAAFYMLAGIYIAQINFFMVNPQFDLDRIYASFLSKGKNEISTSVLNINDPVTPPAEASSGSDLGIINVPDTANSSHRR
jgi:uncharacterized membrane protein YphA (DoxX/SURF4 family)